MKPLRLILPITLFILSGVLAWVGTYFSCQMAEPIFISTAILLCLLLILLPFSIVWALGGFDD